MEVAFWVLKIFAAVIAIPTAVLLFTAARQTFDAEKKKNLIINDDLASQFASQFNASEIREALNGYIHPDYSPSDPSNKDGEEYIPDTRENIFAYLDRQIDSTSKSFNLILADTGMGKTSFCINYFVHLKNKNRDSHIALISLASGDAITRIRRIKYKSKTIIILDALDEDSNSLNRGGENLSDILKQCADFRSTIITCRSQFFVGEEQIPRETPLPRLVPRKLGQGANFTLTRGFISPFDQAQIKKYIRSHFPLWKIYNYGLRHKAYALARQIPDLAYRPMLLERLPDIIGSNNQSIELFDLYELLIEGWIKREERWISPENLRAVSFELAIYIYKKSLTTSHRISVDEVKNVAEQSLGMNPEWDHLHSRSLLNRDSQGRFKFAHRSILEFLVVRIAVNGNDRALELPWTPFMKELLVSWGHAHRDKKSSDRAKKILASEEGRKNISPLFDMWTAPATYGQPDFKRAAQRRTAYTGDRLAPHTWRSSSITVSSRDNGDVWSITDDEFNLVWQLIDNKTFKEQGIAETYRDLIDVVKKSSGRQLPSYDQFISLVDGLYHAGMSDLIPEGDCFVLADEPEAGMRLVARVGKALKPNKHLAILDKERGIGETDLVVSAFGTGPHVSVSYGHNLKVRQLWLCAR